MTDSVVGEEQGQDYATLARHGVCERNKTQPVLGREVPVEHSIGVQCLAGPAGADAQRRGRGTPCRAWLAMSKYVREASESELGGSESQWRCCVRACTCLYRSGLGRPSGRVPPLEERRRAPTCWQVLDISVGIRPRSGKAPGPASCGPSRPALRMASHHGHMCMTPV